MPSENGLSELQEATLFAIWKLRAIGSNTVGEDQLKAQMTNQPPDAILNILNELQNLGFVDLTHNSDRKRIAITPLGVAILRKIEEDRLEEIK